ncbi:MAG: hypothetical protein ACKORL_02620 [Phycisphaerales bacterium]
MTAGGARMPLHRKLFVAMLVAVAVAAGLAALARRTPSWWQPTARDAPGALAVARALEQGIASETTRVRGPGAQPWSVRVRAADVNAWLGARLPQWLEHDRSLPWPDGVQAVQGAADAHGFTLAADWNGFVVSTRWSIEPGAPGQPATLRAAGTSVGSLPVPFAAGVGAWFVPELGQPLPLESRLGDGRRVRIVGAEFADGEAILDCETATAP